MAEENKNKTEEKIEEKKTEAAKAEEPIKTESKETKQEEKKPEKKAEKAKKDEAHIDVKNAKISKKQSMAICDAIRGKHIDKSIAFLESVILQKKALPMKGEIPHRRGDIMAGRFPVNSSSEFIRLLKSLKANAVQNGIDIDKGIITQAIANKGNKVFRKGGREVAKRTHVYIQIKVPNKEEKK